MSLHKATMGTIGTLFLLAAGGVAHYSVKGGPKDSIPVKETSLISSSPASFPSSSASTNHSYKFVAGNQKSVTLNCTHSTYPSVGVDAYRTVILCGGTQLQETLKGSESSDRTEVECKLSGDTYTCKTNKRVPKISETDLLRNKEIKDRKGVLLS
ncbi:hypothetical protein MHLP_02950 [Candidatus Mycoplasma haematolamae str. Purdue]|uniref:Uncharacterized protein n=1 Tax=Mycoplasma haematolamae (strain Purdue) TaxID=1212765 RepID=I7BA56_MYCHA|nr:hypothetical protein [Candidatus Mycoplasma haematolamae]AFO52170.1 hypothetical protein MHLP_02950 [Candidatus Mycoplasma haematolamae str. Purdue]